MEKSPIIVKDSNHMIINPRQNLLDEGIDKIRGGKGMILKGFKTEKTRVEEHLRNINFYYPKEEEKNPLITKEKENKTMQQPVLRFKPRTDLERIFDEINKNSYRKVDKNIIENQIRIIDRVNLNPRALTENPDEIPDYRNATKEEEEDDDFDYLGLKGIIDPLEEKKRLELEKKNKLTISRKKDLNLNARNLMKELHNKTHFKGVTSLVNYNSLGTCYYFVIL
jgi:C1A family cysteine protease